MSALRGRRQGVGWERRDQEIAPYRSLRGERLGAARRGRDTRSATLRAGSSPFRCLPLLVWQEQASAQQTGPA